MPVRACLILFSAILASATSAAVVSTCDLPSLESAVQTGGHIVFECSGTIVLTNTLTITQDTFLDATGQTVVLSGAQRVRLFNVTNGARLSAKGISFVDGLIAGRNGAAPPSDPVGENVEGGAFRVDQGSLVLNDCVLSNHHAIGGHAWEDLPFQAPGSDGGWARGGAIYCSGGSLSLSNCVVSGCSAEGGYGTVSSWDAPQGTAGFAAGGAIYATNTSFRLVHVRLSSNHARSGPIRVLDFQTVSLGNNSFGGALCAFNSAGAIEVSEFELNQVGGSGHSRGGAIFHLAETSRMEIDGCSFSSNSIVAAKDRPAFGGAVCAQGDASIARSTFQGNTATGGDGKSSAQIAGGGAVSSSQSLTLSSSTFFNNMAKGGSVFNVLQGGPTRGAMGIGGAVLAAGLTSVTNCSFVANIAAGGLNSSEQYREFGQGGALHFSGQAVARLQNCTMAWNRLLPNPPDQGQFTTGEPLGAGVSSSASVSVQGSIFANPGFGPEAAGGVTDSGYNVSLDHSAVFTSASTLVDTAPKLGALTDNGGPTPTMALLAGSPAINLVPSNVAPALDQRGVSRPQGDSADAGAVEVVFASTAPSILNPPQDLSVRWHTPAGFRVVSGGSGPLVYRWQKDGRDIPGATQAILDLGPVEVGHAGTYRVIVSNSKGTATADASLAVDAKPIVTRQPASMQIDAGGSAEFSAAANGPDLVFQWHHNAAAIPGANSPDLSVGEAGPRDAGTYFLTVSNFAGVATSDVVTLTFSPAVLLVQGPASVAGRIGCPATLFVTASGVPPFAYQWFKGGQAISNANDATLNIERLGPLDLGDYRVVVKNDYRTVVSDTASISSMNGPNGSALSIQRVEASIVLTFEVEQGRTYRLFGSPDLVGWQLIKTVTPLSPGAIEVSEMIPDSAVTRFYRIEHDCQ